MCEHLDGFRTLVKHDCTGGQKEPNAQDIIQEVEEMLRIRRIECMRVDFWRMSNVIDRTQMGRCARNLANAKDEGRYRHMAALVSVWICDLWFVRTGCNINTGQLTLTFNILRE